MNEWRGAEFANHLIEWLPEYALPEEELNVTHGNIYVKLQQAAVRIYTSDKYRLRGEAGEIALHAICRDYFSTVPISPRVFYKTASNDVIKSFDLVHARFPEEAGFEIWLGESKLYQDASEAIRDAIASIRKHLERGFLKNQKILLGPQIPKTTKRYDQIMEVFRAQTSIDKFLSSSVFVAGIFANSPAVLEASGWTDSYTDAVKTELRLLANSLIESTLPAQIRMLLIYVPLGDKVSLLEAFDTKLKGLQ